MELKRKEIDNMATWNMLSAEGEPENNENLRRIKAYIDAVIEEIPTPTPTPGGTVIYEAEATEGEQGFTFTEVTKDGEDVTPADLIADAVNPLTLKLYLTDTYEYLFLNLVNSTVTETTALAIFGGITVYEDTPFIHNVTATADTADEGTLTWEFTRTALE